LSNYFVDTSALLKRYLAETGSSWVRSWTGVQAGNLIAISELTTVEVVSSLTRRLRDAQLTANDVTQIQKVFLVHAKREYRVITFSKTTQRIARDLLLRHPLRTLDALQLASAIIFERQTGAKPIFVTADQRLLAAASVEGFVVDDPNKHP
jgi:predicted nucleic acid-binding protein